MNGIDNGGQVYPATEWGRTQDGRIAQHTLPGMSLRDWFAGQAMAAMVSCYCDKYITDGHEEGEREHYGSVGRDLLIDLNGVTGEYDGANGVAGDAYIIADAMIREKRRTEGGAA